MASSPQNPAYVKFAKAMRILFRCFGEKGVWADTARYKDTCWTRDFGMAIQPLLLELQENETSRNHLANLSAQQRENGQMPIVFLDDEARWVRMKEDEERRQGKEPFMLRRYRQGELWNLTPGTRDSEILYLVALHDYAGASGDAAFLEQHRARIERAASYVENVLLRDGLVPGADWRDTMEIELRDAALLSNNCLLYRAWSLMGRAEQAAALKARIQAIHRRGDTYLDQPGQERFDPLGASFAVLFGVAERDSYAALERSFRGVDTSHGVTIRCRHNPHRPEEAPVIERTDGVVVWPFVVGFTVLALLAMGRREFAREQFQKLIALDGFWEWYDPATGKGYGAREQLWSATLYMRALMAMD
jgi:hypothetical protein